jgi:hypothetical protein
MILLLPFEPPGGSGAADATWILKIKFPTGGLICIKRFDAMQYARFSDVG